MRASAISPVATLDELDCWCMPSGRMLPPQLVESSEYAASVPHPPASSTPVRAQAVPGLGRSLRSRRSRQEPRVQCRVVSRSEIDDYLDTLEEPKRTTLTQLRDTIMTVVPDAEECISYAMPAFKLRGKTIAGFATFKNHLSYLPHSGSVIPTLAKQTEGYTSTPGSLHFPVDKPLPKALVKELLSVRMA